MTLSEREMAAWRGMLRAHKVLIARLDDEVTDLHDLPLAWYDALVQLSEAPERLRMHAFAERLLLSRSATTRFVDRLESEGLVTRRAVEDDGRGMEVALTPLGWRRLEEAAPTHIDGVERLFVAPLGAENVGALADAFATLLDRIDTSRVGEAQNASDGERLGEALI